MRRVSDPERLCTQDGREGRNPHLHRYNRQWRRVRSGALSGHRIFFARSSPPGRPHESGGGNGARIKHGKVVLDRMEGLFSSAEDAPQAPAQTASKVNRFNKSTDQYTINYTDDGRPDMEKQFAGG